MTAIPLPSPNVTIAGVSIDALEFNAVVDAIAQHAESGGTPGYVVTPNAHHVVLYQRDTLLREIYRGAFLVVPDGVPLLWAAALVGTPLRGRVNGTDLTEALCARAARDGLRVFFLGGRDGAALAAARHLTKKYPGLSICGTYCPPFGFENDPAENACIRAAVAAAQPHLLFVGLGAPKQEYWMHRNLPQIGVPVAIGIGASLEFLGGLVSRAPVWMQRVGLEWFHRLMSEPQRLWKRYVFGNATFCWLVIRQLFAGAAPNAPIDRQ
ncbi:MAG TPA: WecB/TagA/CpsF family glycosyltransferase [Candidatus Acidoferrales bacterium]|nr:WecB/TagA/CpsF family glycosyltransferase [Candidatus Acidoferrales bacterium]